MNAVSAVNATASLRLSSGSVEALKWCALLAMVVDHVNAVFFARELGTVAIVIGRMAMPVFSIILAYNLARTGADLIGCLRRLLLFGALALPGHSWLFAQLGGWWPLNIMATFAVAVGVLLLWQREQGMLAAALFLGGGLLVEYWWPGVALVLTARWYFQSTSACSACAVGSALCCLCLVNGNAWALVAVPVVLVASAAELHVPRLRWVFWWFYPGHLAALAVIAVLVE